MANLDELRKGAVAVLTLTLVDLTAIAIVTQFKVSGVLGVGVTGNTTNATADKWITGLTLFATFITIIIIAIVGKIVIGLFKGK